MAFALHVLRAMLVASFAWLGPTSGKVCAQPPAPAMAAVVRIAGAEDRALAERVRGQTSDLEVRLRERSSDALEGSFAEQLAAARALAADTGSDVAVWFRHRATRLDVVVADLRADRVLVRSIQRGERQRDKSAQEEAAALVVRTALKASLHGQALGAPEHELVLEETTPPASASPLVLEAAPEPPREAGPEPEREAESAPEPKPERQPESKPEPEEESEPAEPRAMPVRARTGPRRWTIGLGAEAGLDGGSEGGRLALSGRVALGGRRLEGGLRGAYGLRRPVDAGRVDALLAEPVELGLAQHRAGGYVAYAPLAGEVLRLAVGLAAGLRVLRTDVRADDERFVASERTLFVAELGAELMLSWLPRQLGGRAGVAIGAALDALVPPVVLGYDAAERFARLRPLWRVQPALSLLLITRL